jgi:hypothetical protein
MSRPEPVWYVLWLEFVRMGQTGTAICRCEEKECHFIAEILVLLGIGFGCELSRIV